MSGKNWERGRDKYAERLKKHTGTSSEKAHQEAAKVARRAEKEHRQKEGK